MTKRQGGKSPVVLLLRQYGFEKIRTGKHEIWRSPGGKVVAVSVSPSDGSRGLKNEMSHVKRIAKIEGLKSED